MANPVPCSRSETAPASLSLLLTRFLTTAFPTLLETMNPIRLGSSAASAAAYNTTFRRPLRTPERTVVEKSVAVLRRLRAASTSKLAGKCLPTSQCLGRQFGAALATTGCQDGAAGTGTHTKAEAVLLGSTAVIRLKSPLAHVSYSSGSKVRPPDQKKGEELADAKFCMCTRFPPTTRTRCGWEISMGLKSGHKGLHNVRAFCAPESNREPCRRLSPAVANLPAGPVDEVSRGPVFRTTPV